jgi:hypothetical protein
MSARRARAARAGLGAAVVIVACTVGCKRRVATEGAVADAGAFDRPADHLGKDELVPKKEDLLGLPLPQGFTKVDAQPDEETGQGEATLEAMRRHVLEHTMNGLSKPEDGVLVWSGAEIPGQGATRFEVRVSHDGRSQATIVVRREPPRVVVDGGSREVMRAIGLDERGYPTNYNQLR